MKEKLKELIFPTVVTVPVMLIYYYLAIPAINLRSFGFWAMIILAAAIFIGCYASWNHSDVFKKISNWINDELLNQNKSKKKYKKRKPEDYIYPDGNADITLSKGAKIAIIVIAAVVVIALLACLFSSSVLFRASDYQEMLTVTESDFANDIAELPISQIPVVDKDTAERLGNRKLGEIVELVSQFNVSAYYSQINYNNAPYRVSPLEYAGLLKWMSNRDEGIPYYVSIDMATQETNLVKLDEGMKYSPSEYLGRDLKRYVRFKHPTKMFDELSFEIDDYGTPYWVMSYYTYTFGILGGKDIAGIILVNAITGELIDYPVSDVPQWIDGVYSAEMLVEQADNWGSLKNGFFNSIFVQKNVVVTTEGYNYIAVDDDVWLYTGITSVSADESNIGFILINKRTKEAKTYMINGAEEYSAMESAEGQIQEKGYTATFPILINVAGRPTYFISLKDNAGLVKAYSFVSVADYQIVGVADTIDGAKSEYLRMLGVTDEDETTEGVEFSGTVENIATAVKDGNSLYYIMVEGKVYTANISLSDMLPFIKIGDNITFVADENGKITKISVTD